MRVLYVENAVGFGGSLTGLLELIRHLPSEVVPILASNFEVRNFVQLPESLKYETAKLPEYVPQKPAGAVRGLFHLFKYDVLPWYRELKRMVDKYKPDLIHGNNACRVNLAVGLAGRRLGVPTISHQKGFEYDGKLERLILKRKTFTHHIATSPAIGRRLMQLGLDPKRCTTMYEPITPSAGVRNRVRKPGDPIVIAMCSMLTPWKGQDVFLKAVGLIKDQVTTPIRVVLAGASPSGDDSYPGLLRALCKDLKLEDIVDFRGRVVDVYRMLLNEVDIATHSSVEPEPFGRVVAEAMICGLPVIASDDGGPGDYITHGKTGMIFPRRDESAMAECLLTLINDESKRAEMGAAAREYALHEFEPNRLAREMTEFYHQLLGK